MIYESLTDNFGLPLMEAQSSKENRLIDDSRVNLDRARSEVQRSLDDLRDLQKEITDEKIAGEVRSAILSLLTVEKDIITSTHKIENLVHRIKKQTMNQDLA